ncbi:MAG: hypothetical protein EXR73_09920 [Myxococcales bacterium]|nr:hypothetical protein [Myxococcales bacterium]
MRTTLSGILALVLSFMFVAVAHADEDFAPLPTDGPAKASGIKLRVVGYEGGTNGELIVEIKNTGAKGEAFSAKGLYFVPGEQADKAPQRVGAVGPYQVMTDKGWERKDQLEVAPGKVVKLKLDVYCIDSHRASPSSATKFTMAKTKVPKDLTEAISRAADEKAQANGGYAAPASKSAVQGEVWKNRDKKWIKLDGEGKQERSK